MPARSSSCGRAFACGCGAVHVQGEVPAYLKKRAWSAPCTAVKALLPMQDTTPLRPVVVRVTPAS